MIRPDRVSTPRRAHRVRRATVVVLVALSMCVTSETPVPAAQVVWSVAASPNVGNPANELNAVSCATASTCAAVGYRVNPAGIRRTLIETWDGSGWAAATSPNQGTRNNTLYGVSCPSATRCLAAGSALSGSSLVSLIETWDGTTWSVASSPNRGTGDNELVAMSCVSEVSCIAVGYYDNGTAFRTLVEKWNGTTWSVMSAPNPVSSDALLNGVSCVSAVSCVAVGYYDNGSGSLRTLAEKWNGTTWTVTPSPNASSPVSQLNGVSCVSAVSCVAVGWYGEPFTRPLVERWNGSTWTATTNLPGAPYFNYLQSVSCTTATSCVAVGRSFDTAGERKLVETLAGTTWSVTSTPNAGPGDSALAGVSCATVWRCIAVGAFAGSGVRRTLVLSGTAPPDVTPPTVSLSTPKDGAYFVVGQNAPADYACVDEPNGWGLVSCAGTVPDASPIDTSAAGVQSFTVTATDGAGNSTTATASYTVVEPMSVSSDLPPGGGSITTDPGAGPTPSAPIATTITSGDEGTLRVDQDAVTLTPPSGFTVLGMQIDVVAPPASPESPLTLVFDVDAAMLPAGTTPDQVSLLKDAALVPACAGATTLPALVDACVTDQVDAPSGGGDVRLTAIAATGGQWNVALGAPVPPKLTISNVQRIEGNSSTTLANFDVALAQPSALTVTVAYGTANGTATAGSDYTATSGSLTFTPGQRHQTVSVPINGDTSFEPDETFTVTLSSPSGATLLKSVGTGTILNDDSTVPGPPRSPTAAPGDARATVKWTAPVSNGNATITGYVVTPYLSGNAQPATPFNSSATTQVVTGLTNTRSYTFKVAAVNARGTGAQSVPTSAITVGAPAAPTAVSATKVAAGSLRVTFAAPADNGAAISGYTAVCTSATGGATKTQAGPASPITVSGLTAGQTYTCTVKATNSRGTGPASSPSAAVVA